MFAEKWQFQTLTLESKPNLKYLGALTAAANDVDAARVHAESESHSFGRH